MHNLLIIWLWLSVALAPQAQTPDLRISLHDAVNLPIVGATITIRDQAGARELAHATTDAHGRAQISGLTAEVVRIQVRGRVASGQALYQPGDDAQGIQVFLSGGTLQIALRSEADGMVVLDPAMAAVEVGAPLATAIPTALVASPVPQTTASPTVGLAHVPTLQAVPVEQVLAQAAPQRSADRWGGIVLIGLIVLGIAMLIYVKRGAR